MTKISIKSMSDKELDAFIKRVEDAIEFNLSLDKADILMLLEAFKAMMFMQDKLAKNDLTILKLKKLLGMVSASEKLKGQMSEDSDTPPTEPKPKSKPSSTSGGKKPKDSFKNKETVALPVEGFSKGDSCPECKSGKLYKFDPAEFLRVSGHAPFKATLYVKTRLRCNTCQHVVSAKLPDEVSKDGEGSQRYGYSARALMALHKYASGLPFYRQENLQTMLGMSLSASTIFDQCEYLANAARPIVNAMTGIAAKAEHFHLDDTTNRILDAKPTKKRRRGSLTEHMRSGVYTSGMIATYQGKDIVFYKTNIGHGGEFIDEILSRRDLSLPPPILMSDALASNRPTAREVIWSLCNVHSRRGFIDLKDEFPDEVAYVVQRYDKIFAIEREAKRLKLDAEARLAHHQKNSGPIFDEISSWAHSAFEKHNVEPNSLLGDALRYFTKHENGLRKFLEVPGAKLDNNSMEQALKLVVLGRKNFYFFKSEVGAAVADVIMSLVATVSKAGINLFEYLCDLQHYHKEVKAEPEKWLPWAYEQTIESMNLAA